MATLDAEDHKDVVNETVYKPHGNVPAWLFSLSLKGLNMLVQDMKNCVIGSGRSGYWIERETDFFVSQSELSRWLKGKLNLGSAKLDAIGKRDHLILS